MMAKTRWKKIDVEGWELYEVSTDGRVRQAKTGKVLKSFTSYTGARRYAVQRNDKRLVMYAAQIVAIAYIDGARDLIQKGYCCRHKNFDIADDRLANIEIVTKSQLVRDAKANCKIHIEGKEKQIYQLWYDGYRPEQIKSKTGVAVKDISKYLSKNNLRYRKLGSQRWYDETSAKIRKLYTEDGLNKTECVRKLGLPNRHLVDLAIDSDIKQQAKKKN